MADSLRARKILVTRPEAQAENLCRLIEEAGGQAIRLPVISIRPVADTGPLERQLALLTNHDIGIFVSQNAVRFTLQFLGKEVHALEQLRLVAVGKATASALQRAGLKATTVAGPQATTETLLELPLFQAAQLKGKKVLIFRGVGGRERLADTLHERGATVDYLEVYQRLPATPEPAELEQLWANRSPDCVVVTSDEGLQNLLDMLSSRQQSLLLGTPLVVLSARVAELAINLGYRSAPVVASETSDAGLLQAIIATIGVPDP